MPWTDDHGIEHPVGSDWVTEEGLRHIQACPACRPNFRQWLNLLDTAAWVERGKNT